METEERQKLVRELENGDDRQRRAASYKLSKAQDKQARRALMGVIDDADSTVRANAIAGLRSINTAESRDFLAAHHIPDPQAAEAEPGMPTASPARRFVDLLIDQTLFLAAAAFLVDPVIAQVLGASVLESFWASILLGCAELALGYFLCEWLLQKTPGKYLTGTKVVRLDGSKPDAPTIAKRTLIRLVPFEPVSFYTGNDPELRGTWWHDRWTGTRVVRE